MGARCQPVPQRALIPLHPIASHPGRRDARVARALQHLAGQLRLGRTAPLRRNAGARTALGIVCPRLGQREFASQQDMAWRAGRGQKYSSLAMRDPPGCAALLSSHTGRMLAFCEQPCRITHEHGLGSAQRLDHRGT